MRVKKGGVVMALRKGWESCVVCMAVCVARGANKCVNNFYATKNGQLNCW